MKTTWLNILIPIIIEGQYDFNIWYGIAKEQSGTWWEKYYRICKETIDLVIIPGNLYLFYGWDNNMLCAFYIAKWFGACDAIYIGIAKLFNLNRVYLDTPIWWLWWTPLGIIRSQIIYSIDLSTFHNWQILSLFGNWHLKKGILTKTEFFIQLMAGALASYFIYHFKVFELIKNFIRLI